MVMKKHDRESHAESNEREPYQSDLGLRCLYSAAEISAPLGRSNDDTQALSIDGNSLKLYVITVRFGGVSHSRIGLAIPADCRAFARH